MPPAPPGSRRVPRRRNKRLLFIILCLDSSVGPPVASPPRQVVQGKAEKKGRRLFYKASGLLPALPPAHYPRRLRSRAGLRLDFPSGGAAQEVPHQLLHLAACHAIAAHDAPDDGVIKHLLQRRLYTGL